MSRIQQKPFYNTIPAQLTEQQFNSFIFPSLSKMQRGPERKLPGFKIFNYLLTVIHTGVQWRQLPIRLDKTGKPEIHYSRLHKVYARWAKDGSLEKVFISSVSSLSKNKLLDISILHGDGSTHAAKKGGDNIGYSGHKHYKGEKIVAVSDRHANVVAAFTRAPGNRHEGPLFGHALSAVKSVFKKVGLCLKGIVMSLDSAYDSAKNRKMIFNSGMTPNIKENKRNSKKKKPGPKRIYKPAIFRERFSTVERTFAWEDKFKRLLMRFEQSSLYHYGMKLIGYTMINLRHFCNA